MIRLVFVGKHYEAQVAASSDQLQGVEVNGFCESLSDLGDFEAEVVVCDLRDLGRAPKASLRSLLDRPGLELALLTYSFAPRQALESLRLDPRVRIVQAPVALAHLRAQMVHLIVRDILAADAKASSPPLPKRCPHCGENLTN